MIPTMNYIGKGANPRDRDARGIPVVVLALEARKTRMANWLLDSGLAVEEATSDCSAVYLLLLACFWLPIIQYLSKKS